MKRVLIPWAKNNPGSKLNIKYTFPLVLLLLLLKLPTELDGQVLSKHFSTSNTTELSVGANFGTKSLIGLDIGISHKDGLGVRVGFNYLDLVIESWQTNFNIYPYEVDIFAEIHYSNLEFLVEYHLLKKLKIVGGAAVFFQNSFTSTIGLAQDFQLNDVWLTPEEVGKGTIDINFDNPIAGYIGLSYGKTVPEKLFNFSVDLGAYYKSKPIFGLTATSILADNHENEALLNELFSNFRWYPVLSFRVGLKLI